MKAKFSCPTCGKELSSAANVRRHIDSLHLKTEKYVCECNRRYRDPTGRSRCRSSHKRFYRCPVPSCFYESIRKDLVKQHLRKMHPTPEGLEVLTLYWTSSSSSSSQSSTAGDLTPPPPPPVDVTPTIPTLQLDSSTPSPTQYPLNWTGDLTAPPPLPINVTLPIPPLQLDLTIPSPIQFSLESQMPILQQYSPTDQSVVPRYWSTSQAAIPQYWSTNQAVIPQYWSTNQSVITQQWSTDQSVTALTALWGDQLHL